LQAELDSSQAGVADSLLCSRTVREHLWRSLTQFPWNC